VKLYGDDNPLGEPAFEAKVNRAVFQYMVDNGYTSPGADGSGANLTNALQATLAQVRASLPEGVEVVTTYDRSSLIWRTLTNFGQKVVSGPNGAKATARQACSGRHR